VNSYIVQFFAASKRYNLI